MMAEADLNVIADMGSLSTTTFPVRYLSLITGFLRFEQKTLSDYIVITLPSLPRIGVVMCAGPGFHKTKILRLFLIFFSHDYTEC